MVMSLNLEFHSNCFVLSILCLIIYVIRWQRDTNFEFYFIVHEMFRCFLHYLIYIMEKKTKIIAIVGGIHRNRINYRKHDKNTIFRASNATHTVRTFFFVSDFYTSNLNQYNCFRIFIRWYKLWFLFTIIFLKLNIDNFVFELCKIVYQRWEKKSLFKVYSKLKFPKKNLCTFGAFHFISVQYKYITK